MNKNRHPFLWTIVIVLAIIGLATAVRRVLILEYIIPPFNPPKYPGFDSAFFKYAPLALMHIIPGTLFMILGPLLFVKRLRENSPSTYRWIRNIYLFASTIIGITAIGMSFKTSIGGANETAATTLFAVYFLLCIANTGFYAIKKNAILYREWLLRSFAIGLAIATIRPIVGMFFALSSLSPREFFGIAFWLGFTIHLMIVEAWIRYTRQPPQSVSD